MARYTSPRCRLCRRLGEKLYLKGDKCFTNCVFDKRPYPPGPRQTRRRKVSDRGLQWREKQKARAVYGSDVTYERALGVGRVMPDGMLALFPSTRPFPDVLQAPLAAAGTYLVAAPQ